MAAAIVGGVVLLIISVLVCSAFGGEDEDL
jgi:hypothetical protein